MCGKRKLEINKLDWIKLPQGSDYHGNGKYYFKLERDEFPKLSKPWSQAKLDKKEKK